MSNNDFKYFMYSRAHHKKDIEIASKIDKKYVPLNVVVGGRKKQYTDIVDNPADCRYSDAVIVTTGVLSNIKYDKR